MTSLSFAMRALTDDAPAHLIEEARFLDACEMCYATIKQDRDSRREPARQALQDVLYHPVHRPTRSRIEQALDRVADRGVTYVYTDGALRVTCAGGDV